MKMILASFLGLVLLQAAPGGGEVSDDSTWYSGNTSVTVDISLNPTVNTVSVKFTDSNGTSTPVTGTPGPSSTAADPTAVSSPEANTPTDEGDDFRIKDGKVQVKNSQGKWVNMREKENTAVSPGDDVVSLPRR